MPREGRSTYTLHVERRKSWWKMKTAAEGKETGGGRQKGTKTKEEGGGERRAAANKDSLDRSRASFSVSFVILLSYLYVSLTLGSSSFSLPLSFAVSPLMSHHSPCLLFLLFALARGGCYSTSRARLVLRQLVTLLPPSLPPSRSLRSLFFFLIHVHRSSADRSSPSRSRSLSRVGPDRPGDAHLALGVRTKAARVEEAKERRRKVRDCSALKVRRGAQNHRHLEARLT
jgi:hypothetical protein